MYSAIKTGLHEGRGDWNMLQRLWSLLMTYSCHNTGKRWSDYVETKRIDLVRGICRQRSHDYVRRVSRVVIGVLCLWLLGAADF